MGRSLLQQRVQCKSLCHSVLCAGTSAMSDISTRQHGISSIASAGCQELENKKVVLAMVAVLIIICEAIAACRDGPWAERRIGPGHGLGAASVRGRGGPGRHGVCRRHSRPILCLGRREPGPARADRFFCWGQGGARDGTYESVAWACGGPMLVAALSRGKAAGGAQAQSTTAEAEVET